MIRRRRTECLSNYFFSDKKPFVDLLNYTREYKTKIPLYTDAVRSNEKSVVAFTTKMATPERSATAGPHQGDVGNNF